MCRAYVIMYIQKTYTKIKRKIKKVKKTGQKYCLSIKNLYETYALTFLSKNVGWVNGTAQSSFTQPAFEGRGQLTKEI